MNTERPKSFEENFFSMADRLQWETRQDTFIGLSRGSGALRRAELAEMGWPSMSLKLGRLAGIPLDSLSFANYHKGLREGLLADRYYWGVALGVIRPEGPDPEPPEHPGEDADAEDLAWYQLALSEYNEAVNALSPPERAAYDAELAEWQEKMEIYRTVSEYSLQEYINYLFLTVSERLPTTLEREQLIAIMQNADYLKVIGDESFLKDYQRDDAALLVFDYQSRLPENYYLKAQ